MKITIDSERQELILHEDILVEEFLYLLKGIKNAETYRIFLGDFFPDNDLPGPSSDTIK